MREKLVGFYNYTVLLTYLGVGVAIAGIGFALMGRTSVAILCLMAAGLCDMFDGRIAKRRTRTRDEQLFGIQIDSLSDLICFGALPAVIGYSLGLTTWYGTVTLAVYVLAALIRLAYYNVTEEAFSDAGTHRVYYDGLPVTACALLIPLLYTLRPLLKGDFRYVYMAWLLVLAGAYIIKVRVRKPGLIGMVCTLFIAMAVLAGVIAGWNQY